MFTKPHETHARLRDSALGDWSKIVSAREREVVLLVARGLSNKVIARELGLREGTVKLHVHNIFRKLRTKRRYDLIHFYYQSGDAA
jgi:DNA-binding NarL/FixJ family response regulator